MDNDVIVRQFEQIEQRVGKLIDTCRELETKNIELKSHLARLEEDLQSKQETEKRYQAEKRLVRTKIDGLLTKLDTLAKD